MFCSKKENSKNNNMTLDFSSFEKDCRSMGGLFQQLSHEMKHSSSVWQDFISKSNKFHTALGTMTVAMTSFIDSFQRIADMANNSKGAVRDIGGALTKLCLRQRSVEAKLKEYVTILGGTFSPIPGLLDDWKKTVIQMDHAHAKEYKKLNNEIQKNLNEANKLKKQVEKGGRAEKLQPSLDSKIKAVEWKYSDLATNECVSLKKLTLHERQRFSFFVKCLSPLLEKQGEIFVEATSLEEIKKILLEQTKDPDNIIKSCEDFVDEFWASKSDQEQNQQLTFVTPPGTPRCLTRHPSSLSIRSSNSALNQKRPYSLTNKQEHGDGHSVASNSVSTAGAFETDSMVSQDTIVKDQVKVNPPASCENQNNDEAKNSDNPVISQTSNCLTTFASDRRTLTNSYDSLARKRQPKPPNSSETEDAELWLAHRNDPNRFFNRGMPMRNSMAVSSKNQMTGVQPLDSPVRPGRKNDKRATIGYSGHNPHHNDFGLQSPHSPTSSYATLGRSSFKTGSIRANFYGGNYSTGKISHNMPTSPPPPPPLPFMQINPTHNLRSQSNPNEQFEALLRTSSKKFSAPPPPTQTPPTLSPPSITESQGSRNSSFAYSPLVSVVSPSSQNACPTNENIVNESKQRLNNPLSITIPYYSSQTSTANKSSTPQTAESGMDNIKNDSPTLTEIPIRILRKYPEGLVTPPASNNLEIMAPPKPPPPIRNSSMAADQSAPILDVHVKRHLSRTPSFKQQSAPKDCPPLPKATPLTISDHSNNNNGDNTLDVRNNNNKSSLQRTNIA